MNSFIQKRPGVTCIRSVAILCFFCIWIAIYFDREGIQCVLFLTSVCNYPCSWSFPSSSLLPTNLVKHDLTAIQYVYLNDNNEKHPLHDMASDWTSRTFTAPRTPHVREAKGFMNGRIWSNGRTS